MVDGELMVEVHSVVKIHQKLIDQEHMLLDGLLNHWLKQNFVVVVLFKYHIVLQLLNHYQLLFLHMVHQQKQIENYLK
jgi:broad-specificity NMP kinase